ncbi:subtilase-type protease inhibitor [Actinomadura sp. ATCC 31491]|uniref:Subtilase-type protease inhibitor n=1 Tax=Actinomadura luzonensis TaxID=2805427 RepID=A0ABT0FZ21_9ACTN|nr:SSI family serine proteinase inhibitor [Actinomadura luzonensis]MCK2217599.1 subtilase-type protease inhibitor [Actinomadura luzonensis]
MKHVLAAPASLTAALLTAGPLAAPPAAAAARAGADLVITVTPVHGGGAYRYFLSCDPDDGGHPRPGHACYALRAVNGVVEDLDVDPGACTKQYSPVDVDIVGRWRGREIGYHREFPNKCVMDRTLGPVV